MVECTGAPEWKTSRDLAAGIAEVPGRFVGRFSIVRIGGRGRGEDSYLPEELHETAGDEVCAIITRRNMCRKLGSNRRRGSARSRTLASLSFCAILVSFVPLW